MVRLEFIHDQSYCSLRYLKHYHVNSGDDLILIAKNMEELIEKFKKWTESMETTGLQINMKK